MDIDSGLLIAFVGICLSAFTFFIGRQSSAKNAGVRDGILDTKIEVITSTLNEIKQELRETNLTALKDIVFDLKKHLDKHDESIERLHTRMDSLAKQ